MKNIVWTLYVDGASRNNPGVSGAGIYIEKDGILFIKCGYYLGIKTNNQAEYLALLLGLFIINEHILPEDSLIIVSDSKLLIQQLLGAYKVKNTDLYILYQACKKYIQTYNVILRHVLRNENKRADAMANYGVDSKLFPPKKYIILLENHGIQL